MLSWRECKESRKWERELSVFFKEGALAAPDIQRKGQSLEFLRQERKKQRLLPQLPYGRRVWDQAAYVSPLAWAAQGALVFCLGFFLHTSNWEQWRELFILSSFAPIMGIVGFTEILRSYREHMWELEQACRYNLRQLMGMRLLIFGAVDALAAMFVFLGGVYKGLLVEQFLLLYLVPQLLSDCVYLRLLTRFRGRCQGAVLLGAAVGMAFFWMWVLEWFMQASWPLQAVRGAARMDLLARACAWTLASAGLLAFCCVKFINGMEKEDDKWNFGWTA